MDLRNNCSSNRYYLHDDNRISMTQLEQLKAEVENHLRDIIEDSKNPVIPLDMAIKEYAKAIIETIYQARTEEVCNIIDDITAPEGAWREALEGFKKVVVATLKDTKISNE